MRSRSGWCIEWVSKLFSFCFAVMACLNTLKLEIKTLEKIFTKNHERFRILNASVDELTCRFVGKGGKLFDIHANITVSVSISKKNFFLLFFLCVRQMMCKAWKKWLNLKSWMSDAFCIFLFTKLTTKIFCGRNDFFLTSHRFFFFRVY